MFMGMIDQTIVAAALPAIAVELGGVERIAWVVVFYLVASAISAPVSGRLADALGRRKLLIVALVVSMSGGLLCALSNSLEMLVVSRTIQGLGGGALMSISLALIGQSVPPRERAKYQGYIGAIAMTASSLGPVAGGLLTEAFGWRSVFLLVLPLGAIAALLVLRLPGRSGPREAFVFDWLGLVLFSSFVSLLIVLVNEAGPSPSWGHAVLAVLCVACVALFLWRQKRAPSPLLPLPLLRNPSIWRSYLVTICHGAVLVSLVTFVPLYLRAVRDASAAEIGLLMLPMTLGVGLGSIITGQIVSRTGRTAIMPSIGLLGVMAMLIVFGLVSPAMTPLAVALSLGVVAMLLGTVMNVVQLIVASEAGPGLLGTGAGAAMLSRSLGAAIGASITGAVLFAAVAALGTTEDAGLQGLLRGAAEAGDGADLQTRDALELAFRYAFFTLAGFAGLGSALAWTIPRRRL